MPWPLPAPWPAPPLTRPTPFQKQFWNRAGPGDRYRVEGVLTAGGQARLWQATDRDGRTVVVKMLREDRAGRPEARRLVREGRILHDLTGSPLVMELLAYGPDSLLRGPLPEPDAEPDAGPDAGPHAEAQSDFPWLVLPLHRHRRLDGALQELGPFGSATGRALGRDLAAALSYLHRNAVFHRDVTPGNVLLTSSGLLLADLGVAWSRSYRDVDGRHRMTTGLTEAVGLPQTPSWSAPEVAPLVREDRSSRNAAVDVFAWGLYVATATTGRHPWADPARGGRSVDGDPAAMRDGTPPTLTGITDRHLRDAVAAALAADPDARPTADELHAALSSDAGPDAGPRASPAAWSAASPAASPGASPGAGPALPLGPWTAGPVRAPGDTRPGPPRPRALRPSLGLAAAVLLLIAVLLLWAAGVFRVIAREFTPFEQAPAARSSSLDRPPAGETPTSRP